MRVEIFSLILFYYDLKSYFKLTKYQKKKKEKSKKSHHPIKEKEERKKNSPGTRKIDLWQRPKQLHAKVEWRMEFAWSIQLCFVLQRQSLRDTVQFRVIHKYMVAHFIFLFFGFCLDFKYFNIQVQVYFLFIFFQITQPTETYKKRVKIKKLVSKNLPKKSQELFGEYFTISEKLNKRFSSKALFS